MAKNESNGHEQNEAVPTIEEHAQRMQVAAPVFAAVMQAERWANGKRVSETDFKRAVSAFLGAPMGGAHAARN